MHANILSDKDNKLGSSLNATGWDVRVIENSLFVRYLTRFFPCLVKFHYVDAMKRRIIDQKTSSVKKVEMVSKRPSDTYSVVRERTITKKLFLI